MDLGGAEKLTRMTVEGLPSPEFSSSVCCLKAGGHYAEQLRDRGHEVEELLGVPKDAFNSIGLGVKVLWRLWRYLRRTRPDILHTHLFLTSCIGRLVAPLVGIRHVVVTIHRVEYPGIQKWIERALSPLTTLYVTDSIAAGHMLVQRLGVPETKLRVIYNGIDTEEFRAPPDRSQARNSLGLDADEFVIGVIAHLYREKGHAFLLDAVARAKPSLPRFKLIVVGDGYLRHDLEQQASFLGLGENVTFLGQRSDLALLLAAMDVFVLPSSWEGFGIVLAEAMYMRVPVITTRNGGGCAEVVEAGDGGLLVDFGDIAALSGALKLLASAPPERKSMGDRGHARVTRMFTAEAMIARYAEMYRTLTRNGVA